MHSLAIAFAESRIEYPEVGPTSAFPVSQGAGYSHIEAGGTTVDLERALC